MKTHRNVTPRQEAAAARNLFAAIASLRTAEECRAFFHDLCTPAELQAMADRWAVVDFLKRGLPYREIHRLTGVSVTTIGRVARFLESGNGGYALAAQRLGNSPEADSPKGHSNAKLANAKLANANLGSSNKGIAGKTRRPDGRAAEPGKRAAAARGEVSRHE